MLAGMGIGAENDTHDTEEVHEGLTRPPLTPCAPAQRGDGQLDAEYLLGVKGAKREPLCRSYASSNAEREWRTGTELPLSTSR